MAEADFKPSPVWFQSPQSTALGGPEHNLRPWYDERWEKPVRLDMGQVYMKRVKVLKIMTSQTAVSCVSLFFSLLMDIAYPKPHQQVEEACQVL